MLVRCLAMMALLVLAAGLPALAAPQTPQATAVLIENYEDGIGAWTTNDGKAAGDPDKVTLCTLSEVTPGAPGMGGARCALVEFQAARTRGPASPCPSRALCGPATAARNCG